MLKRQLKSFKFRIELRFTAIKNYLTGYTPRPGDQVRWCGNGDDSIKTVAYASVMEDTVEYTDGSSDSYAHCAWEKITVRKLL